MRKTRKNIRLGRHGERTRVSKGEKKENGQKQYLRR